MSSLGRIIATLAAAIVLADCGGASFAQKPVPDAVKRTSYCDVLYSTQRSPNSARHVETSGDCSTSPTGGVADIFYDVESFYDIVDAIGGGNPCDALAKRRCADGGYNYWDDMIADPGGPARRGDNCTPVNGYAIGYSLGQGTGGNTLTAPGQPIPATNGTTTIVNQSQVFLQNFSAVQPIGWLVYTQANGVWFVPNLNVGFAAGVLSGSYAVPGAYKISPNAQSSGKFVNTLRGIFNLIANQNGVTMQSAVANAFKATGGTINNVPCNTTQLT